MKHFLPILFACMLLCSCGGDEPSSDDISVAWNTYEKIYEGDEIEIWEIVFTEDSLHTYWKGDLEVSASYIQNGSIVDCVSIKDNHFTIVAGKGYIIYSDKTFTKRR